MNYGIDGEQKARANDSAVVGPLLRAFIFRLRLLETRLLDWT